MSKKLTIILFISIILLADYSLAQFTKAQFTGAQFTGTQIYALKVSNENRGYLILTFNPDRTIIGEARIDTEEEPLPLTGVWGRSIFVVKYTLTNDTRITDHCQFISNDEFVGFERSLTNGTSAKEINKIFGSRRDNI